MKSNFFEFPTELIIGNTRIMDDIDTIIIFRKVEYKEENQIFSSWDFVQTFNTIPEAKDFVSDASNWHSEEEIKKIIEWLDLLWKEI